MTVVECEFCGGELPADLIEETTVDTISPLEATVCEVCQLVQDYSQPEGHCLECGDVVDTGCYIELEYPAGVADIPANIYGTLCGECAARHAFHINYRGVESDNEASEQYTELVDKQSQARLELERSA